MEILKGTIGNIIFHNERNGYTVMDMDVDDEMVTAVGTFEEVKIGEFIKMEGEWTEHPIYGEQFIIRRWRPDVPTTEAGVIRYLSSGVLPGVGEKIATDIVSHFGLDTLDILDNDPDRLSEVRGIGKKTLTAIKEAYHEQKEVRDIMMAIQEYGISATYAMKLYKTYKSETVHILLDNPYKMVEDVRGIGFKTADQIAAQLGFAPESPKRIVAGIRYCLSECYSRGNTYMTEKELIDTASHMLYVAPEEIVDKLQDLVLSGAVRLEFIDDEEAYYPPALLEAEDNAALSMVRLARSEFEDVRGNAFDLVQDFSEASGLRLDDLQQGAVQAALENGLVIITGGPGTGKTTIIKGIVSVFKYMGFTTVLAAPTGRAAKRMSEATGIEAKTIHRLLEYEYSGDDDFPSFCRNAENPIEADAVILDESSMIDILLLNNLLEALRPGTRLVLVGDADQLPSVGPGNVLKDLIDSSVFKVVRLTRIYRQSQESMISLNAWEINNGCMPQINNQSDFMLIRKGRTEVVLDTILDLVAHRIPEKKGFDPIEDIQVIAPIKKGMLGVVNLNKELQAVLNPSASHKLERTIGSVVFREGDKVMQIRNNYQMVWEDLRTHETGEGVYNGDIGRIARIENNGQHFVVVFSDDKKVTYDIEHLDELTHAYAMTVHKSQGSEFPVVIMPLVAGAPMFLNRKLLYTGVTRAKKLLMLIGPEKYFSQMIKSSDTTRRQTALKQRIQMYNVLPMV